MAVVAHGGAGDAVAYDDTVGPGGSGPLRPAGVRMSSTPLRRPTACGHHLRLPSSCYRRMGATRGWEELRTMSQGVRAGHFRRPRSH